MASSKAKIDDLLKTTAGGNGTLVTAMGKITDEFNDTKTGTLAKKIADAIKTPNQALDFSADYNRFAAAVTASTDIIDKALESNDLTELDTTNLKALKSYINETKATFDAALKDSGLDATKPNTAAKQDAIDKLKAGLKPSEELAKIATEKAIATHAFSQQQPETVADMREDLGEFLYQFCK